jgi:outer membrane immunogenic protein
MTKLALLASSAAALVLASAAASAADLPYRRQAPVDSYAPVFTTFTWTGGYVGANVGWRAANFDPVVNAVEIEGKSRHSIAIGGHAGYNYQIHPNWVLGGEVDFAYANSKANGPAVFAGPGLLSSSAKLDWSGSLRGRLGYTQGNWMVYGTGGLAFADLEVQAALTTPGSLYTSKNDKWAAGYAVGAGVEYMLTPNIVLRGEYLYSDYGRHTVAIPLGGQSSVEVDSHTARGGVSYKF